MASSDRRAQYKTPPANITTSWLSQEHRRNQALENQKRRRAQRIDSARNLDLFAGLTLGPSDDEEEDEHQDSVMRGGVGAFASMLHNQPTEDNMTRPSTASSSGAPMEADAPTNFTKKKGRKKRKAGKGNAGPKPSRYADKCMYAELLEMRESAVWGSDGSLDDSLPQDLEFGWVTVAPVPAGKRCLVVTYQSSGVAGVVPNTQLRSRLLGKSLIRPFPSPLPAHTILDCILDENWRENGLLHVLDVVKWKGQDVGDCETSFRFWFRDSRLAELPPMAPPLKNRNTQQISENANGKPDAYRFPYPCTFLPIPYDTNTTLPHLLMHTVPLARSTRTLELSIPHIPDYTVIPAVAPASMVPQTEFTFALPTPVATPQPLATEFVSTPSQVGVRADGLLLYVAQATYEPGTSPLSSWIPIANYDGISETGDGNKSSTAGRLELFERLVRSRLEHAGAASHGFEVDMMQT